MSDKGLYSPIIRRIVTIVLLIGVTSSFFAVYYFVYLPQERAQYNLKLFRVLHEITNNFRLQVDNYGIVCITKYVSQHDTDDVLRENKLDLLDNHDSGHKFNTLFLKSFHGNPSHNDSFPNTQSISHDSVLYHIKNRNGKGFSDTVKLFSDTVKLLSEILDPLISLHKDDFESFLLIKQNTDTVKPAIRNFIVYDSILYESDKVHIANIKTDSLFANRNIESPTINDITIEGVDYKMFMLPFKMKSNPAETYILAGVLPQETYRNQSQSIPVDMLLSLSLVLIILLLALPFLKIFFLSAEENITIKDVRTLITVIFIIPFFVTMLCSGIVLYLYASKQSTDVLTSLQHNVQQNFCKEIIENIQQLKRYDSIVAKPSYFIGLDTRKGIESFDSSHADSADIKDVLFNPSYKSFTDVHWMDSAGNDIASWNLVKLPASYFKLSDRQYFKDIIYKRYLSDSLWPYKKNSSQLKDSFSVQPVLSRLTGDYTINVSMNSKGQTLQNKSAKVIGLSGKMYSVYNTIVPNGYAFCIINEGGDIICHSDTARSLQENIFQEGNDSFTLRSIISHKDSAFLPDFTLYEKSVKMIIKPMAGLPYYLVTYYDKRADYFFVFHILSFVFVCESTLLLLASLFSYFMMLSSKKNSKLFFQPATLHWLRPSSEKRNFYIKNSIQLIASLITTFIVSLFFINSSDNGGNYYLYVLNAAILLPLFVVTGYYIIKRGKTFLEKEKPTGLFFSRKQYGSFLLFSYHILLLYFVSAAIFWILHNVLFFNTVCTDTFWVQTAIVFLILAMPFVLCFIAGIHYNFTFTAISRWLKIDKGYLYHFIISMLLAVALISVVPAFIFTAYAFREEKRLHVESLQVDMAKKIQERRDNINPKLWLTKLNSYPFLNKDNNYLSDWKFKKEKGIYLLTDRDNVEPLNTFNAPKDSATNCSPFYKTITKYLFLPPDHDEFFEDVMHNQYYFWANSERNDTNKFQLNYKNITDYKTPASFSVITYLPHSVLFEGFISNYLFWMELLCLIVFMFLFFKIIYSISTRVFLIDFFEKINGTFTHKPDKELEKEIRWQPKLQSDLTNILGTDIKVNFELIRNKENERITESDDGDDYIIDLHLALVNVYENIWKSCTDVQKYTLYDFATDGFSNYKKVLILYQLYKDGLMVKERDGNITLITKSFRNFLMTKESSEEIKRLSQQGKKGSWGTLRTVFYVILIGVCVFIFISQDEASKRLITIVTSLGALLPAILKLFDKNALSAPTSKSG